MTYTKWRDLFPSVSFLFIFGRGGNGNEVSTAGEALPMAVCTKSSPSATK